MVHAGGRRTVPQAHPASRVMAGGKLGPSGGKIQIVKADAVTSWSLCFAQYLDYLYVSFTNATACGSKTRSHPLGRSQR
jgi:hypothetical protein